MTGNVFQDRILALEWQVKTEKRRVLLLINNCLAHKNVPRHIEHMKVMFLLPNCLFIVQPLDQRIIHDAKVQYRSWLVWLILANISVGCDIA
jgi:hypothetical protein